MRLNIFLFIFSHSSTAVTHPPMQSKSRMHPRPMRFACTKATWEMCLICNDPIFWSKKTHRIDRDLQVMSQLLGSDRPVRSSILYLLALGYSQKIDPREWREKPLLIWYDPGRREQMGTALGRWRLLMLVLLVSSLGMNQNLWNTFT